VEIRNKLLEEHQAYSKLDFTLAEKAVNNPNDVNMNSLALDSAMRMATVRGIELFTNFHALSNQFFDDETGEKDEV